MQNSESNITFGKSLSINSFKDETGSSQIEVAKNPNTNKLFFVTDAGISGKVSTKITDFKVDELQVVRCEAPNEPEFWMLCKKSSKNTIATL